MDLLTDALSQISATGHKDIRPQLQAHIKVHGIDDFVRQVNEVLSNLPITHGVWHVAQDLDWKDAYNFMQDNGADMPAVKGGEL